MSDLRGQRIAVVEGTTGSRIARKLTDFLLEFPTQKEAIDAVEDRIADGLMFDAPALLDWRNEHPESRTLLRDIPLRAQNYAFAITPGNELRREINRALLLLTERQRIRAELELWLPVD